MDREMASTAPISQPSQYMMATTRQITPAKRTTTQTSRDRTSRRRPDSKATSLTCDGEEHWQQQQRMGGEHGHGCHTYAQRQQETPKGTLHTCRHNSNSVFCFFFSRHDAVRPIPMISMKICFQCSHVWKPRRSPEVSGREASCSWTKFSQRRKSE